MTCRGAVAPQRSELEQFLFFFRQHLVNAGDVGVGDLLHLVFRAMLLVTLLSGWFVFSWWLLATPRS